MFFCIIHFVRRIAFDIIIIKKTTVKSDSICFICKISSFLVFFHSCSRFIFHLKTFLLVNFIKDWNCQLKYLLKSIAICSCLVKIDNVELLLLLIFFI